MSDGGRGPTRLALRLLWAFHRALFRISGGRVGTRRDRGRGVGTLFLTTTGRRTGRPRRTGLFYVARGDDLIVVASNAGSEADPAWWLNLQARPDAEVDVAGELRPVRGRAATPSEAAELWPELTRRYRGWDEYRRRVDREIPIVVLERRDP